MKKYKLLDGTHTLDNVVYRKGGNDVMTLSDDQARKLGGRVVLLHSADSEQQSTRTVSSTETEKPSYTPMTVDDSEDENGTDDINEKSADDSVTAISTKNWSKTQDMKATDVIAMIKETDSMEELEALREVEENGQNRIGVMKEIDKRTAQLEEDE